MRNSKSYLIIIVMILVSGFLLAACATAADTPVQDTPQPETEIIDEGGESAAIQDTTGESASEQDVETAPSMDQKAETDEQTELSEDETAAVAEVAQEPESGLMSEKVSPPNRGPDLHATDPATVNLASGEVYLVEFFAYW